MIQTRARTLLAFTALAAAQCVACSGSSDASSGAAGASVAGSAESGAGAAGASSNVGGSVAVAGSSNAGSSNAGSAGSSNAGSSSAGSGNGGASSAGSGNAGASSAGSSSGGTSGVPFKGVANSPCAARTLLNVSWYYNWTQKETEPCTDGAGGEFVPMIWGHAGAEQMLTGIQSSITGFVSKKYGHVLGFNEPDNSGQSNLTTATALSLLPGFNSAGILVGTPATQANTTGQAWFKDYMGKVANDTTLRADFIALHWYGWNDGSCDAKASQLESYLKYAEGFPGNRPIWLTEWSCLNLSAPTPEGVLAFYQGALAVFAKHPRVQRYAWYPWTTNCELNDKSGALTPLGKAYANAPAFGSAAPAPLK
jgi:Glycosyl hydrolase catalytic core